MKKKLAALLFSAMMICGTASAIRQEDVSLGGIYLGMPYEAVISQYGLPTREENGGYQLLHKVIFYGDSVEIGFLGQKVRYVTSMMNNGWNTPAGIHAGMDLSEAVDIYGTDYKTKYPYSTRRQEHSRFYFENWQGVRYAYSCVPDMRYSYVPGDVSWYIYLDSSDGGKTVTAITIGEQTPEN